MIIIDGKQAEQKITHFANLEELLVAVTTTDEMCARVVTDVFVNNEQFSELYPHQAEDIEAEELNVVEIRSVPSIEMASSITEELTKVVKLMQLSSTQLSEGFRNLDNEESVILLVDTIDVIRSFMAMVGVLRSEFIDNVDPYFTEQVEKLSGLLIEFNDSLESEDWFLLADLLEYEFTPICENWNGILANIKKELTR